MDPKKLLIANLCSLSNSCINSKRIVEGRNLLFSHHLWGHHYIGNTWNFEKFPKKFFLLTLHYFSRLDPLCKGGDGHEQKLNMCLRRLLHMFNSIYSFFWLMTVFWHVLNWVLESSNLSFSVCTCRQEFCSSRIFYYLIIYNGTFWQCHLW